ncbi:MAG: sulfurtransferase TusA family protein [Alteromonadaceae bacterium]|nr:sulfurtransferase TusA family protein [Alteromonadaceae bacterium]
MLYNYDAYLDKCPLPLVKTRVFLKKMQAGDICLIRIYDQGSKKNILNYLTKFAWSYSQKIISDHGLEIEITK